MRKGNVRGVETVGWIFRHRSSPSEGTLVNEVDQSPTREWNFRVISHCLECLLLDYIHRQATLCSEHLVRIEVLGSRLRVPAAFIAFTMTLWSKGVYQGCEKS